MRDFEVRNQFATAWHALYRPFPFRPALDEFKIDTAGDAVAEMAYQVRVSPTERGRQIAILCRLEGPQAAGMVGEGQIIVERAPASTGRVALVTEASHYRHFAGWRSDPFFFDRRGMLNNLWFTGAEWIKQP